MKIGWKIPLLFFGITVLSGIIFLIGKTMQSALPADGFLAAIVICSGVGVVSGIIQIYEFVTKGKDKNDQGEDRLNIIVVAGRVSHSLCSETMTQTVWRLS